MRSYRGHFSESVLPLDFVVVWNDSLLMARARAICTINDRYIDIISTGGLRIRVQGNDGFPWLESP